MARVPGLDRRGVRNTVDMLEWLRDRAERVGH